MLYFLIYKKFVIKDKEKYFFMDLIFVFLFPEKKIKFLFLESIFDNIINKYYIYFLRGKL